ncbi:MAG: polyprenol monophosphomannose synthase [Chloroflexi bacterium]|nr:polyprenol monophosphomannose synthase [Chloroflexota bacterium]
MKITAVLPTYNEAENIADLLKEILALGPEYHAIVVDDNSPDGTADLARKIDDPRVTVIKNPIRTGRGASGTQGMKAALEAGADIVIEMDADFSHEPSSIPCLVEALKDADIIIGSRYVEGGGIEGRSAIRDMASDLARKYLQFMLGTSIQDPQSGFRAFKKEALEKIELDNLKARDPFVVTESLFYARKRGLKIAEAPIIFKERRAGASKISTVMLVKYLGKVFLLRIKNLF